jgi:hypothetical protein
VPRYCENCGAGYDDDSRYCIKCGSALDQQLQPVQASDQFLQIDPLLRQRISPDARRAILQAEIAIGVQQGYRVVSQSDFAAQLVKPKVFSCCWALIWTVLLLGIIFYLIWYMAKKDKTVYVAVDEYGEVTWT